MSNQLKASLREKLDTKASANFDAVFFKKLEKSKVRPKSFSTWITWAVSGCATASVLFIAINNYKATIHSFNHKEYIESGLEIQSTLNNDMNFDETVDLTTSTSGEI